MMTFFLKIGKLRVKDINKSPFYMFECPHLPLPHQQYLRTVVLLHTEAGTERLFEGNVKFIYYSLQKFHSDYLILSTYASLTTISASISRFSILALISSNFLSPMVSFFLRTKVLRLSRFLILSDLRFL